MPNQEKSFFGGSGPPLHFRRSDSTGFFRAFSPRNRPQIGFLPCGLRDRKNATSSKIAKSSNFYGFRGGLDPSDFELNIQPQFAKNDAYRFSIIAKGRPFSLAVRGIGLTAQGFVFVMQIPSVPSGKRVPIAFGNGELFGRLQDRAESRQIVRHGPFPVRDQG